MTPDARRRVGTLETVTLLLVLLLVGLCAVRVGAQAPTLGAGRAAAAAHAGIGGAATLGPASPAEARHRDPDVAMCLGALVPGLGHAYAGEWWRGLVFAVGTSAAMLVAHDAETRFVEDGAALVAVVGYVVGLLDAREAAARFNERERRRVRAAEVTAWRRGLRVGR